MKIFIFGTVASGKTTLAKKLSAQLNIRWYEGDGIAWGYRGEERFKRSPEEQARRIQAIDARGEWIIEGSWRESQKAVWELADRIIFLDTPLRLRRQRIWERFLRQRSGKEPCSTRPTFSMLRMMFRWTENFEKDRPEHEARLLNYADKLIWLVSDDLATMHPDWLDMPAPVPVQTD
ncbi:MAG: hypothetical protein IJ412_08610 [Oscillospiraceae bacterium]|nr:hypothetical protein [Oscillospiraceae bacterium]